MTSDRGTIRIRIRVDGDGDVSVTSAFQKVRATLKATDDVKIEGRYILVELKDRYAADAAPAIIRRLEESLEDYQVDFEVEG